MFQNQTQSPTPALLSNALSCTGHRKLGPSYNLSNPTARATRTAIRLVLEKTLDPLPPTSLLCGMAIGADTLFAEEALALGIPLVACIPFVGQESKWPSSTQRHYHSLLGRASSIHITSDYPSQRAFILRNHYLVENSSHLIAVHDGRTSGGTHQTITYAASHSLPTTIIDPTQISQYRSPTTTPRTTPATLTEPLIPRGTNLGNLGPKMEPPRA